MYGHVSARLALMLLLVIFTLCAVAVADELVFSENFDDGNWTANPTWETAPADPSVSISADRFTSTPYSLKIDASNNSGAIRTLSGLAFADESFDCTFSLYAQSIAEEAIPWCLQSASNGIVAILFLLPQGRVQLSVTSASGSWVTVYAPTPLSYGAWHQFRVSYDGSKTDLYIDGAAQPDVTVTQAYVKAPTMLYIGSFGAAHSGVINVDDIRITAAVPPLPPAGKLYVQFCSDTSTGGLGTSNHYNTFPVDDYSYVSPTGEAAQVMAESYRDAHRDSLGNTIKLTWYMNCGSIYSGGITTGPIFPYELMMDNHGAEIARWGDEMAYHYHTWFWDGEDWTQTAEFTPCLPDFEQTMAHFVLDRDFYPTSFRSGWNWMSTLWENYLDDWMPYRFEGTSPLGTWIPYHPSSTDWRAAGDLRGWESLHDYTPSQTASKIEAAFSEAYYGGKTQVMTLWSHLKETDFATRIDEAHGYFLAAHSKYPTVEFEYLTGRECMLKWRGGTDTTPPVVTVSTSDSNGVRTAIISTNEFIYQRQPFVALMKTDGAYSRVEATGAGIRQWSVSYNLADTLKIAVGLTDWFGNATVKTLPALLRIYDVTTSATTDSAEITWQTSQPTDTALDWRVAPSGSVTSVHESALTAAHHVTLGSLQPGQIYRIDITATDQSGRSEHTDAVYILTKCGTPVIIDNSDPGFSVTGSWATGTSAAGHYGPDYRNAGTSPTGTSTANWTWQVPSAGTCRISAWWSQGTNRSNQAKYSVLIGGSEYVKIVNQQADGGVWNALGVYDLVAGQTVTVRLMNSAPSGYVVIADAACFETAYVSLPSLAFSRLVPDGSAIRLPIAVVTAVFDCEFYVQETAGVAGIKVIGGGVTQGSSVEVSGTLSTINGERVITNPIVK